jgi:hypothetical protein
MSRALESQLGALHLLADAELTRFRIVKEGSDVDHVAYPAAITDRPAGLTMVEGTVAAEDPVAVRLFSFGQTGILKMSGTGSKGDLICPAVDGTGYGRALPSSGQVYVCARALEDWTADQEIGVETLAPALFDAVLGEGTRLKVLVEAVAFGDFTDGGSTAGTLDLTAKLPAGAQPMGGKVVTGTGWTGDTSAAMDVGTSGDPDAFIDNVSVLAAATVFGKAADPSLLLAETTVQVTVTGAADFGAITAGASTVYIFYHALA